MTATTMQYAITIELQVLAYAIYSMDEDFKLEIGIGHLGLVDIVALLSDAVSGATLLEQIGAKGGFYPKEINGRIYVILTGYPGLRSLLKGTKYLPQHPLMVKYGIGPLGKLSALKSNFILSMTLYTTIDLAAYIAGEKTLGQITGNLAWNAAATALSGVTATAAAAAIGLVTTLALPGILGGIVVGAVVSAYANSAKDDWDKAVQLSQAMTAVSESDGMPDESGGFVSNDGSSDVDSLGQDHLDTDYDDEDGHDDGGSGPSGGVDVEPGGPSFTVIDKDGHVVSSDAKGPDWIVEVPVGKSASGGSN